MKKYKLIKAYPGNNLTLGDIVTWSDKNAVPQYICLEKDRGVSGIDVSLYPEFWEEVVEKDYEILKCAPNTTTMDIFDITSVKRLSDGQVFKIDDNAKTKTSKGVHKIESIRIAQKVASYLNQQRGYKYDGIDRVWVEWDKGSGGNWLEDIELCKQPLFKTEDGVDIFEGQKCFVVSTNTLGKYIACYHIDNISVFYLPDRNKYFSTKEKAVEFILFRKPLLSLSDVFKIYPQFKKAEPTANTNHAEKLIEFVKNRQL